MVNNSKCFGSTCSLLHLNNRLWREVHITCFLLNIKCSIASMFGFLSQFYVLLNVFPVVVWSFVLVIQCSKQYASKLHIGESYCLSSRPIIPTIKKDFHINGRFPCKCHWKWLEWLKGMEAGEGELHKTKQSYFELLLLHNGHLRYLSPLSKLFYRFIHGNWK